MTVLYSRKRSTRVSISDAAFACFLNSDGSLWISAVPRRLNSSSYRCSTALNLSNIREPGYRLSARNRRQKRDFVAFAEYVIHTRIVRIHRGRNRALVLPERWIFAGELTPYALNRRALRDFARELGAPRDVAEPREQPHGYAHATRSASARAPASSGSAVAPSIHTSPPSKNSRFQMGAICFTRSMT